MTDDSSLRSEGDLAEVKLLKRRRPYLCLDWGPFAIVYGIALGDAAIIFFKTGVQQNAFISTAIQLIVVAVVHSLLALFCHWNVAMRALVRNVPAENIQHANAIMVRLKGYTSRRHLVPLTYRRISTENTPDMLELGFDVALQRYVYQETTASFEKLAYPIHEPLAWYLWNEGFRSEMALSKALAKWGPNLFEVSISKFLTLLMHQLLAPFFVFQFFCFLLWCLEEHWMYPVVTLSMMVLFEGTVTAQRQRNLRDLRSLQSTKQSTNVYRFGKWERIRGEFLLPGDVVSIGRLAHGHDEVIIPADMVLISGTCIVDESVLTGESTPQWKSPLNVAVESGSSPETLLDLKRDKAHILFGGTKCLQHTASKAAHIKSPDGACLAVVIRTGFETAQGSLMRTILHSSEHYTANNWETGMYILFLLCFAAAAAGYVLYHGLQDPNKSRFQLFLHCTVIITSVIPAELPMELTIAVNQSLIYLMKKKIFCTEPFRIPFAGKVDVCCFDKTGTLTDDSMRLDGVAGTGTGMSSSGEITPPTELPPETARVLAACHSLVVVDGDLIGDPLEIAAFQAIGWSYRSDLAVHPRRSEELMILHRYHFSAQLKRMSVTVRLRPSNGAVQNCVLSKGAPEVMHHRFRDPPADYGQLYKRHAAQGGRVIALGYRLLDPSETTDDTAMRGNDREVAESDLHFVGFAVFQCPLKADSAPTLRMLKQSSHQLVMITGDAPLTACNAASHVHIITRPVLILHCEQHDAEKGTLFTERDFVWSDPEETHQFPFDSRRESLVQLATEWDLCVTGEAFPFLQQRHISPLVLPLIQVFARVAPEHKEHVVDVLRSEGHVVLMCGDGTNDVGGLKAAHVGVALLTGFLEKIRKLGARKRGEKPRPKRRQPTQSELANNPSMRMIQEMERQGKHVPPRLRKLSELVEDMNQESALVKPGDASMAAPFTARHDSVAPCADLIMQGRSTLVSTVQMFKILGLNSLANAFALSVIHFQGVKTGDIQMTIISLMTCGMFFFLSNTKPLTKLSKTRPHPNIFSPYVFISVMGQSLCHLVYLITLFRSAVAESPETLQEETVEDEEGRQFKPSLVNSVCFLVNFTIQVATFAVNYSGAPFTTPLLQNRGLSNCLYVSASLVLVLTLNLIPWLTQLLELVEISAALRLQILALGVVDFVLTFFLERLLRAAFPAPLPVEKGYMTHRGRAKIKKE